jgi:hypothetical protein
VHCTSCFYSSGHRIEVTQAATLWQLDQIIVSDMIKSRGGI